MENLTSKEQLTKIAYGACFLGSGGGGPLSTALHLIENYPNDISVTLYDYKNDLNQLNDNEQIAILAIMGAPDAMLQLDSIASARYSFEKLSEIVDKPVTSLVMGEIGPTSMIAPLLLASEKQLKIIDADGVGRAVPSLVQCLFAEHELSTDPSVIANSAGQDLILPLGTPEEIEDMGRSVLTSDLFNQQGAITTWVMNKQTLPNDLVNRSVSICLEIGSVLQELLTGFDIDTTLDSINTILTGRKASLVFAGKLSNRSEVTKGGFDFGTLSFTDSKSAETCTIFNQNENLIAWSSKKTSPMVLAPDSICYLSFSGQPYTNADFTEDQLGKGFYIIKVEACAVIKQAPGITASFKDALLNLGYGGTM